MNSNVTHSISKQSILKRMLRSAANYLGVKRIELLDPLVVLFMEALAEEIYTVSSEIGNIEMRMLNTLAGLIAPGTSLLAHPAHCIMHALPQEPRTILSNKAAFVLKNEKQLPDKQQLTFYPLHNTVIHSGGIRYMSFNGLLYQIDADQSKTLISRSRNAISRNSVWIGLELSEAIRTIKNLSFYIDFGGVTDKDKLLNLLPYSTWKLNANRLNIKLGLHQTKDNIINETVSLFNGLTTVQNLYESIEDHYSKHFLAIDEIADIHTEKKSYPLELRESFPAHIFEDLTNPLLWFEIEFPTAFTMTILESMHISINAFPVINKSLHNKTVEIHESLGIIALETGNHESLLAIDSITDSLGQIYHELPFNDTETESFGTYSIRRGGYERYSKREMREYLQILVKQMENLSAVNSTDKQEENEGSMSLVHGFIKHIKDLIAKSEEKLDIQYYVLIDKLKKSEVFFINYWTTNCRQANNIKQYTAFDYEDTDGLSEVLTCFSLSDTYGGKSVPDVAERQNLQLKSLTEQSVLVTDDDIIKFCNDKFGNIISHVNIAKGIMENPKNKQEFVRTKDITLTCRKELIHKLITNEAEQLKLALQQYSPAMFTYRIIVK